MAVKIAFALSMSLVILIQIICLASSVAGEDPVTVPPGQDCSAAVGSSGTHQMAADIEPMEVNKGNGETRANETEQAAKQEPTLYYCANRECREEKTKMSRQIRTQEKDVVNLVAVQKDLKRRLAEMFDSKENYKKRFLANENVRKALESQANVLEKVKEDLDKRIQNLEKQLKAQVAESVQALEAQKLKATHAMAEAANTAQVYKKLQDIHQHQTNRFQDVWREKEEMRMGIAHTNTNLRHQMKLVKQENLALKSELAEKNASLQTSSKNLATREEILKEAEKLANYAEESTETACKELIVVRRDLQEKIEQLEEQLGNLKKECKISKNKAEELQKDLAEKEDKIAELFHLLEKMEEKKEQALQNKDNRIQEAFNALHLEIANVQRRKEELMLTCANWKSKEEQCCKCMAKDDKALQLEIALRNEKDCSLALANRIRQLEKELALMKSQANNPAVEEELVQPTSAMLSTSEFLSSIKPSNIKKPLKLAMNLSKSCSGKRREERKAFLEGTGSDIALPTMNTSTTIALARSQSQEPTPTIPPKKKHKTVKFKGIMGKMLEAKYKEKHSLSKELQDECSRLTNLEKTEVTHCFHLKRKNSDIKTPVTKRRKKESPILVPHAVRAILHAKFKQTNGILDEKECEELSQQTKLSPHHIRRWFKARATLRKDNDSVADQTSTKTSNSHVSQENPLIKNKNHSQLDKLFVSIQQLKNGSVSEDIVQDKYEESVSNSQTEGSNQSERRPFSNLSCSQYFHDRHLNRFIEAVNSLAEKVEEEEEQVKHIHEKTEINSQLPSTSPASEPLQQQQQQLDSLLFNTSHDYSPSTNEHSRVLTVESQLNVSPLEQASLTLRTDNPEECSRLPSQEEVVQILESHYQASPCRLKKCRLQELCRITHRTKSEIQNWFRWRREIEKPEEIVAEAAMSGAKTASSFQSTSAGLNDLLETIFQKGYFPKSFEEWEKLGKVDVSGLYHLFNQREQHQHRAMKQIDKAAKEQYLKQLEAFLEKHFQQSPTPNPIQKKYLCQKSKLTAAQIDTWFMERNQKQWKEASKKVPTASPNVPLLFNSFNLSYLESKFLKEAQADKVDMEEMICVTGADPAQIYLWFEARRCHEKKKMAARCAPPIDANAFAEFLARSNEESNAASTKTVIVSQQSQVQSPPFAISQQASLNLRQHHTAEAQNFLQQIQQTCSPSMQGVVGCSTASNQAGGSPPLGIPTTVIQSSMVYHPQNESPLFNPCIFNQSLPLPPARRIMPQFSAAVLECFNKPENID